MKWTADVQHKNGNVVRTGFCAFVLLLSTFARAQSPVTNSTVPSLVNYNGTLTDGSGKPLTGISGVTFSIYKSSEGGAPLWMETQNVRPDRLGRYTVQLGSTSSAGLPSEVFMSGEARWLGVQVVGEAEQPRVLLVAVPYAMKAGDATTLGGLPPSAFVLAAPPSPVNLSSGTSERSLQAASAAPPASSNVTTTGGTVNTIPLFSTATNIQNSILSQIGTTTVNVAGKLTLPANGTATAAAGKNSRPEAFVASAFNSSTVTAIPQTFQWQAEPAANNTTAPSGTLNLLYGLGTATPTETGLKISPKGLITFPTGQTFPGAVTSVGLAAPATDFTVTGSPVTNSGTLAFSWKTAPTNADTANAIVKRDATGSFNVTGIAATGTISSTTANTNAIIGTTSLDGGSAIVGSATATGGSHIVYGVTGKSLSAVAGSTGVLGLDDNTNSDGSGGFTIGVQGYSSNLRDGMGVFGFDGTSLSSVFNAVVGIEGVGVWGDGGSAALNNGVGVIGTVDDGTAGYFANNSSSGQDALDAVVFNANSLPFGAYGTNGTCTIDSQGNLNCTGSKNAVVPVDGGKRIVAMSAIEAPQNWFEDAGEAELVNGAAVVQLDSTYTQTVNSVAKYQVFLTPYGDCKGLYVTRRAANSFEVHELGGGTASLSFGYRIMAIRAKYENVRFADHTHDLDGHNRMMERMRSRAARTLEPGKPLTTAPANTSQLRSPSSPLH